MQASQHTNNCMATNMIVMPVPWHRQGLEASFMNTQPVETHGTLATQTCCTLAQPWIITGYSTGLCQRQAAFVCLDRFICFHNTFSYLNSHQINTQVKFRMNSVIQLMTWRYQSRNTAQETKDHVATDSNWRKSNINSDGGCNAQFRGWTTSEVSHSTTGCYIHKHNVQEGPLSSPQNTHRLDVEQHPDMMLSIEMEAPTNCRSKWINPELQESRPLATTPNWSRVPFVTINMIL